MLFSKKSQGQSVSDETLHALGKANAIIWIEPNGNIREANENFLALFGYTADELEGQRYDILAEKGEIEATFWKKLENGTSFSAEFPHRHKNGSSLFVEASFTAVGDAFISIAHDVTAKHLASLEAQAFSTGLDSNLAVIEFNNDGTILQANTKFLQLTGHSNDAVVGHRRDILVSDTDNDLVWRDVVSGKTRSGVYQRRTNAGQLIWLHETYFPVQAANGQSKIVGLFVDISDTVEDTVDLTDVDDAIAYVELTTEGTITSASSNFLKLNGFQSGQIIGEPYSSLFEKSYDVEGDFLKALEQAGSVILPIRMKSGDIRWYRHDFETGSNGIVASVIDVTAWKTESDALSDALAKMAGGDLTIQLPDTAAKEWRKSRTAFNELSNSLQKLMSEVADLCSMILADSGAVADSSQALSERCEQQAASVEETSTSMEEMSSSVRSNAQSAKDATKAATNASGFAEEGQKIVEDAIMAMNKIEDGSGEVRKIIEVIDAIAFQTNLLALNAGVEAARAGEAGRGFAVVASEVRALAQRASDSARDINALIESSGAQVQEGATLVKQTGDALKKIVDAVTQVSTGIEGIFVASTEQSEGVQEINQAILNIDSTTQKTVAISEESTASAKSLVESAKGLQDVIQFFQFGDQPRESKKTSAPRALQQQQTPNLEVSPPPTVAAPKPASEGSLALQPTQDDDGWDEF